MPRPFSGVLLPTVCAVLLFSIWEVLDPYSDPVPPGALAISMTFAFVVLTVLFGTVERYPGVVRWLVPIGVVWALADAIEGSTEIQPSTLIGIAILFHIAFRSTKHDQTSNDRLHSNIAAVTCVIASASGVGIRIIPNSHYLAAAVVGIGLTTIALSTIWSDASRNLSDVVGGLCAALTCVLAAIAFGIDVEMGSTIPLVLGGLCALGTMMMLEGRSRSLVLGTALALRALARLSTHAFFPLVSAVMIVTLIASGVTNSWLQTVRLRIRGGGDRWFRGGGIVFWFLVVVGFGLVVIDLAWRVGVPNPVSVTGRRDIGIVSSPFFAIAIAIGGMALFAFPWPSWAPEAASIPRTRAVLSSAIGSMWGSICGCARAGDTWMVRVWSKHDHQREPSATSHVVPPAPETVSGQSTARRVLRNFAPPVVLWTCIHAIVANVVANSVAYQESGRVHLQFAGVFVRDPIGRRGWGTGDYWAVADHGYVLSEHREAFFPVVPLLLRWAHSVTSIPIDELQVVLGSASGMACSVLFWAWMGRKSIPTTQRHMALVLFLVFPWNFLLYGYGYADATVVALVLGAFLLADYGRPVSAGIVGAIAAATRPNGIPIIVALLVFELVRTGALTRPSGGNRYGIHWLPYGTADIDLRRMQSANWGALISVTGIGAFSLWMWSHAGNPLYWISLQGHYGHESALHLAKWIKFLFADWPSGSIGNLEEAINQGFTAVIAVCSLLMIPAVWRKFGSAIGLFAAAIWMVAWTGSIVFAPFARYLMPITPFLAVIAAGWLTLRPRLAALAVGVSVIGASALVVLFSQGDPLWVGW